MNILDKTRLLQTSVLSSLILGLGGTAYAQQVEQLPTQVAQLDEEDEEDTIVVTGSRIRRSIDSATPVTEISSIQLENRAFTNVIDAINDIPLVSGSVTNQGGNVQFGDNNAFANLLNIGTNRTLTLVDGQRFVGSNQATIFTPNNAPGAQVDVTILNPALIERTEVQTVGGGAIYGADAVAGVINIILKDDFDGFSADIQAGITEFGDGENFRVSGAWGKNFWDDRANLTLAGEYTTTGIIRGGGRRGPSSAQIAAFSNPLNLNNNDGLTSTVFQGGAVNPLIPNGGLLTNVLNSSGSAANLFFPNFTNQTSQDPAFNNFVDVTNQTPFNFAQNNPGVNPLLFVGTFGNSGIFPTIPNTDAGTSGILPSLAVPLGFAPNGNLVPFDLGTILPLNNADQNTVIGGDGFADPTLANFQSEQERIAFNALWRFDFTDNIRYKGNFLYSEIENRSIAGNLTNIVLGGSGTAGSRGIPVFIDENPFFNAQARSVVDGLVADGLTVPTIGGSRVLGLSRNLADITGERFSGNDSETFRTAHFLEGEFNLFDRDFNWGISGTYGRNTSDNIGAPQLLDVEFALAIDAVVDPVTGNTVCQQQLLDAPQPIGARNPSAAGVNSGLPAPVTPTAAQVAACVPLNLFGEGNANPAAIANVLTDDDSRNESEQFYASVNFGGELVELPAGPVQFNVQGEFRDESLAFTPGATFSQGLGRNTFGQASSGSLNFFEYGGEILVPLFGDDFTPIPFIQRLEFEGAVRRSRRSQSTDSDFAESPAVTDTIYTVGGRWSPVQDLTVRGFQATSVRSAAIVELFGAGQTGFTGNTNPCAAGFINGGPQGGAVRAANCATAAQILGVDPALIGTNAIGGGGVDAATAGNPFLQNEQASNWTAGIAWAPDFIPGFSIESDWISVNVDGVAGLAFPNFLCFDSPDFPNADVGGTPICDQIVFNIEDPNNPGEFIIPSVNPLTGGALPSPAAVALVGQTPVVNAPFNTAFIQFPQLNQGALEFRGLNSVINYSFTGEEFFGSIGKRLGFDNLGTGWGDFNLRGTVFYVDRQATSGNGTFSDENLAEGEPGNARFQTRLDFNHSLGKFRQQLQWFRTSNTLDNVQVDPENFDEQAPDFFNPDLNTFNYNVSYDFTDELTGRFIVNNLTRAEPNGQFGVASIGRTFAIALNARF